MSWQNFFFPSETLRVADAQPTAAFLPQTHGRIIMATRALIECAHAQQCLLQLFSLISFPLFVQSFGKESCRRNRYAFGQFFDPVGRHAAQQRDQPALGVVREPWQVGTYLLYPSQSV